MALAPALSLDERNFLHDQRNSEHFRVFLKAIEYEYSLQCAALVTANPNELLRHQGILQGLLRAVGIIRTQQIPQVNLKQA